MGVQWIERGGRDYPAILLDRLGNAAPPVIHAMGDKAILSNGLLGLVCSIQCSGSIVIQTFDAIRALQDTGGVAIGGLPHLQRLEPLIKTNQVTLKLAGSPSAPVSAPQKEEADDLFDAL